MRSSCLAGKFEANYQLIHITFFLLLFFMVTICAILAYVDDNEQLLILTSCGQPTQK